MTLSDALYSNLERTLNVLAWVVLGAAVFACAVMILGSIGDLNSYSQKAEAWMRIGIGLGIVAGSLVPWAMLRAVAEILVLLKAQNGKKEIE